MSLSILDQLKIHMAGGHTTLTVCAKVVRTDLEVFGFTQCSFSFPFEGVQYEASTGVSASDFQSRSGLGVDNLEIIGGLDSASITEEDIVAGKWDHANAEFFIVNYLDLTQGKLFLCRCTFGELSIGDTEYTAELRGMMQPLQNTFGRSYLPPCDADLGDARCKINVNTFTDGKVTTTVTSAAVGSRRQFVASAITQAAEWFTYGKLVWTSGLNVNVTSVVKQHTAGGNILLQLPTPYPINPTDGFYVEVGCDKTATMCKVKFANKINYRGFDKVPGKDRILSGLE